MRYSAATFAWQSRANVSGCGEKSQNPQSRRHGIFCDPVMGHPEKGCIVAAGVADFLCPEALAVQRYDRAELCWAGNPERTNYSQCKVEAVAAARELCKRAASGAGQNTCPAPVTALNRFEMFGHCRSRSGMSAVRWWTSANVSRWVWAV